MNILLGLTGSVATKIAPKIIEALEGVPNCTEVRVVMTEKATMFWNAEALSRKCGVRVYTERDEWTWKKKVEVGFGEADPGGDIGTFLKDTDKWEKGLPIQHIELAKWASCLVIAPATANTIAKMANGVCDNLLTSIYAAWDCCRPVVIAPAMNTRMWENLLGRRTFNHFQHELVWPVSKELACGDVGVGALADVGDIAKAVGDVLRWSSPLEEYAGVPVGKHPGAFGAIRKHDRHCGVDLYVGESGSVQAVESGRVVVIEDFTGQAAGCPWWNDTKAVKIEGPSGVVCYGEIEPRCGLKVGDIVRRGEYVGKVIPVLKPEKHRPDIPGHSCSMLHLQVYTAGTYHLKDEFGNGDVLPDYLVDPTPYLLDMDRVSKKLDMP